MKGIRIFMLLLVTLWFMPMQSGWAGDKPGKSQVIDTKVTLKLFKEWEQRKTFPDSIPFAYYHAYSLLALEGKLQPEAIKKIAGFVKSCQKDDGGFVTQPTYAQQPNVIFTYYGVQDKAIGFVMSLLQDDGGIKGSNAKSDKANLITTCYGVSVLDALGALDKLDKKKTMAFINRYREQGAGFGMTVGQKSTPEASLLAMQTLRILGGLSDSTQKELTGYFLNTRYSGLIKDKKYKMLPTLKAMSYNLEGLHALSAMDKADKGAITSFVESLYVGENGGFGPQPGLGTTPPSTFHGVVCLVQLGRLPDPLAKK